MAKRYIKLYEQITAWEWFKHPNTLCLFIYLLLKANYKDMPYHGMTIRRGQIVTSLTKLATGTGLSIQQTRTALLHLISTGEVTDESSNQFRVITIVKYDDYQNATDDVTGNQQAINRRVNRQSTDDLTPSIESIERQNDIKENSPSESKRTAKRFTPPTPEDVENFCQEAGLKMIDGELFCDYYASKGWLVGKSPMKDWRATVRNWARRNASPEPEPVKRVIAQDFEQRDYSSVPDEEMQRMAARIARMKAEGRIGHG